MTDFLIKPILPEHEDLYFEHSIRAVQNGGKDGAPPYTPYGQATRFSPKKRKQTMDELLLPLEDPTWKRLWGAWHGDHIIGNAMLMGNGTATLLHRSTLAMGIDNAGDRGQGLGTKLLQTAINWAKKQSSIDHIDLECMEDNIAARKLYEKCGFTVCGQWNDYFRIEGKIYNQIAMTLEVRS